MTNFGKASCWALLGPLASIFLGYAVFILFGFVLGPGFDIDNRATGIQAFFGALALPGRVVVPAMLVPISLSRAWQVFRLR